MGIGGGGAFLLTFDFMSESLVDGIRVAIPVTVHVAIGTDIIHAPRCFRRGHQQGSHHDFRLLAAMVTRLHSGGLRNGLGGTTGSLHESGERGPNPGTRFLTFRRPTSTSFITVPGRTWWKDR
jgi:hypothetical protein